MIEGEWTMYKNNAQELCNSATRKAIVARYQALSRGEQNEISFLGDMARLRRAYEDLLGAEICFEKTTAEIAKGETE